MKGTRGGNPSYSVKNKKSTFPTPKFKRVFDTDRSKKAVVFFEYWSRLPPELLEFCRVKVFRTWPQIDVRLVDPERKDISVDAFEGAIPFEFNDYIHFFLERYSSGSWNCQLYDISTEGGPEKVIECFFDAQDLYSKTEDGQDKYPVRVDLRTVQWGKTHNRNFEEYLRARHIPIPGQEGTEYEEAQEMNAGMTVMGDAMKILAEQNKDAIQENKALLREVVQGKIEDAKTPEAASSVNKTVEMMADAGRTAVEMVKESAAKPFNPIELVREVVTLTKGNDTSGLMLQMFVTSMEKQNAAMVKMHEDTLAYMKTKDAQNSTALVSQKSGIDLLIEEAPKLQAVRDLFGWSPRRGDHEVVAAPPPEPKSIWLEKLVEKPENLQYVMGIFALASNMVALMFGKGKPTEEVLKEVTKEVQPSQPAPADKPTEEPRKPSQAELNQAFCEFIEEPFLEHFFDPKERKLNGFTFAKAFCAMVSIPGGAQWTEGPETPVGRQQYELIKSGGIQAFDKLIRAYSPIWGQVSAYALQPSNTTEKPKYFKFLEDFFTYDQRRAS